MKKMNPSQNNTPKTLLGSEGYSTLGKHVVLALLPWILFFYFLYVLLFTGYNNFLNKILLDLTSLSRVNAMWGIGLIQFSVWIICRIKNSQLLKIENVKKIQFILIMFLFELSIAFLVCLFAGVSAFLIAWNS